MSDTWLSETSKEEDSNISTISLDSRWPSTSQLYFQQCKIYENLFREQFNLPPKNSEKLRRFKIPKRRLSSLSLSSLNDLARKSIVESEFRGATLFYDMPPEIHWSALFGWPWPFPRFRYMSPFYNYHIGAPSPVHVGSYQPIDMFRCSFPVFQSYSFRINKENTKKEKKCKPRFKFNCDRNHDFSDSDEDATDINSNLTIAKNSSTLCPSLIIPTGKKLQSSSQNSSDSGTGTGSGSGSVDEMEEVTPTPAENEKLVWRTKIDCKNWTIVSHQFGFEPSDNDNGTPSRVEEVDMEMDGQDDDDELVLRVSDSEMDMLE